MPELSRFYGIIIKMYFNDTQQHHKPHIHAFYGDYEAVVAGWQFMKRKYTKPGIMPYEENTSIRLIHYKENYNV